MTLNERLSHAVRLVAQAEQTQHEFDWQCADDSLSELEAVLRKEMVDRP